VNAVADPLATTARVVPLIDAVEMNPRPDRGVLSDALEVSFVPMAAVEAATGRMDASAVRRFGEVKKGYTVFREGDVLFAKITPCMENGKMAVALGLLNGVGCGSTEFHVLRPRPGVDAHYVYHFVSSARFRAEAAHHMTGAVGQKRVPAAFLEQCEIPLPSLAEQRRVVAELEKQFSRLDEAVASLKRVKANLARQRAAVLNAAVVGHLTSQREPTWSRTLNAGDPLPDRWRWLSAEELAAPEQGSIGAGPFGTIFKAKDFRPEGVPIIFLRHVAPMKYLQHKPGFMDTRKWEELFRPYSVFGGELLITKLGEPPGVCAIYPAGIGPAMVTPDVIKMRVDENKAVPAYLMYYFNSDVAKRFATGAAFGTTRTRLTLPLFRDTPVVVPTLDEQHSIVAELDRRLSTVRAVETEVDSNLRRAETLRRQILAKAFVAPRGEVDRLTNEGQRRHVSA